MSKNKGKRKYQGRVIPYIDLFTMTEDERIKAIGQTVLNGKKPIAFITDSGTEDVGKADRYVRKLTELYPSIVEITRAIGPVPDTVIVKVGTKDHLPDPEEETP